MEGSTSTAGVTVEEVWREMPAQASGPEWAELIQQAIEHYQDWKRYNLGATVQQAQESGMAGEWADGWTSVYYGDMWEQFRALSLWNVDDIEERIRYDLDGFTAGKDISELATLYCYVAAELTMEAVLRVAEKHEQGGYLCDRCRDRVPFDRIHYVFLNGFGSVCTECYEAIRSEEVAT